MLAVLPILATLAVGCTDESSPEQVATDLKAVAASHDCDALLAMTAPDVRADVECDDHTWSLVDDVAPMVDDALEAGGTFTIDPNNADRAVLPFACRGDELTQCLFEVVRVDGTWYLYDLG